MNNKTKILSGTTAAAVLLAAVPFSVQAQDETVRVRILVENNTFSAADGAAWEGTLVDEWVECQEGTGAAALLEQVLSEHGFTQTGAADNWITDINGLSYGADAVQMGGWMVGLDDWYGNGGITTITPEDGDEIMLSYSLTWGTDIGYDYTSLSTKLSSLTADAGELSPAFSPDTTDYTLTLPADTETVMLAPVAENKGYRFKIYRNDYKPDAASDYKRTQAVPAAEGDTLYIGVGHESWHSYLPEGVTETVYQLHIQGGKTQQEESSEESAEESSQVTEESSSGQPKENYPEMLEAVYASLQANGSGYVPGDEWQILTDSRLGRVGTEEASSYVRQLKESYDGTAHRKATDDAKLILTLSALGYDPTDFGGENLLTALADHDYVTRQGINGTAYSLLAVDAGKYEIPAAGEDAEQNSRDAMIADLLAAQLTDGGWAFFGETFEPDMTGIVLQALALYYQQDEKVTEAVDKALALLSEKQNADGTYTSYGAPNSENSAQVVLALASLNIDAAKDERFVKADGSALDGLKAFYLADDSGFAHTFGTEKNALSTMQAFEALCAYYRFENGQTAFYDMTDVPAVTEEKSVPEVSEESNAASPEESNIPESREESAVSPSVPDNGHDTVPTGDNGFVPVLLMLLLSGTVMTGLWTKIRRIK